MTRLNWHTRRRRGSILRRTRRYIRTILSRRVLRRRGTRGQRALIGATATLGYCAGHTMAHLGQVATLGECDRIYCDWSELRRGAAFSRTENPDVPGEDLVQLVSGACSGATCAGVYAPRPDFTGTALLSLCRVRDIACHCIQHSGGRAVHSVESQGWATPVVG